MKNKLIWIIAVACMLSLLSCRSPAKAGRIYGTYRIDAAGTVDINEDGIRTVTGEMVLNLMTTGKAPTMVELKELDMISDRSGDSLGSNIAIDPRVNRHFPVPAFIRIPFSGHYSTEHLPSFELKLEADGKDQVIVLEVERPKKI